MDLKKLWRMDWGRVSGSDTREMEMVNKWGGRKGVFIFMALDAAKYPFPILFLLVAALIFVPQVKEALPVFSTICLAYYTLVTAVTGAGHWANYGENKAKASGKQPE